MACTLNEPTQRLQDLIARSFTVAGTRGGNQIVEGADRIVPLSG
jgi:hypothetical protein